MVSHLEAEKHCTILMDDLSVHTKWSCVQVLTQSFYVHLMPIMVNQFTGMLAQLKVASHSSHWVHGTQAKEHLLDYQSFYEEIDGHIPCLFNIHPNCVHHRKHLGNTQLAQTPSILLYSHLRLIVLPIWVIWCCGATIKLQQFRTSLVVQQLEFQL